VSLVTKRLSWALALSLLLNLFLLAYGVTRWARGSAAYDAPQPGVHHEGGRHLGERGLGRLLGPPTPELRGQHRALRDARRAVGDALKAEPYDRVRLEQALTRLRETTGSSQVLLHQKLLERAGELSADERDKLAKSRFVREFSGDDRRPP
jgi:uncharacterized membrane protein